MNKYIVIASSSDIIWVIDVITRYSKVLNFEYVSEGCCLVETGKMKFKKFQKMLDDFSGADFEIITWMQV